MEGLLVLLGLVVLATPVAVIVLIVTQTSLRRRVSELERQLVAMQRAKPVAVEARPSEDAVEVADAALDEAPPTEAIVPDATPSEKDAPEDLPPVPEPVEAPTPPVAPPALAKPKGPGLGDWLRQNWFYALSAISLALAGVFLVQYGIENGYLTPTLRVVLAAILGLALIAAGEVIRRRSGDEGATSTIYLPSTFSGAGLVTLYGAALGARVLYDLIGPAPALVALAVVSAIALVFGWFYGPFLVAIGLIGGAVAPFLVGGSAEDITIFLVYYGLIGAVGLGVDGVRRWRWVSFLALGCAMVPALLMHLGQPQFAGFALMLTVLAALALALPSLQRFPTLDGPPLIGSVGLLGRAARGWPRWETLVTAIAVLAATLLIALLPKENGTETLFAALMLLALIAALAVWAHRASAFSDLTLLPGVGLLLLTVIEGLSGGGLTTVASDPEAATLPVDVPRGLSLLLSIGTVGTLMLAWRSGRGALRPLIAAGAVLLAPGMAVVVELFWIGHSNFHGHMPWALHVLALAALMTLLAERFNAADGPEDRRRMAYAAMAALALIALVLFILLTKSALTVALAVLISAAAWLDRRFRLPEMTVFLIAGILTLGWRLVVDPGIDWFLDAAIGEIVLAYGAALLGLGAAHYLMRPLARRTASVFVETAFWSYAGILACLLLYRWIERSGAQDGFETHWGATLFGLVWLILALAQLVRMQLGGPLQKLRLALAAIYAFIGGCSVLAAALPFNPLISQREVILGPLPFDTLLVAYAVPAALLLAVAWRVDGRLRLGCLVPGAALAALWLGLEIRRFWLGEVHVSLGTTDPELYTYTVVLLLLGGGLLYQAIASGSMILRRVALVVIGLAVAKVFLIDAQGLTGLLRVFSFLALGLSLAGLAWLDRWAAQRFETPEEDDPPPEA